MNLEHGINPEQGINLHLTATARRPAAHPQYHQQANSRLAMPAQHWPLPTCPTGEQIRAQGKCDLASSGTASCLPSQALYQPWSGIPPALRAETRNVLGLIYPGLTPAELELVINPGGLGRSARLQGRSPVLPPPAPIVTAPIVESPKRKNQQASTAGKTSKKTKATHPSTTGSGKGKGQAVSAPPPRR